MLIMENQSFNVVKKLKVFDNTFEETVPQYSPGFTIGVIKDGKTIYSKNLGLANIEHKIPITNSTVLSNLQVHVFYY